MTELVTITPEERKAITEPASRLVSDARAFKVVSVVDYGEAATRLKTIKAAQKTLDEKKKRLTDPINSALRAVRDLFRGPEEELNTAEGLYKREMASWSDEQERIRREAQRKADEAAERERKRLEQKAADDAAKAAALRAAGNADKAAKLEQRAEERADAAAAVVAPVVQREPTRVAGIAERENWSAIVHDFPALVQAVAAGTVPYSALEANAKFLNNQARAMKRELKYPGVRAVVDRVIAAGSR